MEQKTKGSGFLKVTGILMIIGGAIALIVSIIAVAGIGATVALAESFWRRGVFWNAVGGRYFVACKRDCRADYGIVGVKNCKDPAKAGSCMVWGIIEQCWP